MIKLAINGGEPVVRVKQPHYVWPRITKEVEAVVLRQLHTSVSIYDRSGIILEFEENFRRRVGRSLALVTSSGTTALFSAFEGLGLKPGDEVIVPAYTFFATASPLVHFGVKLRQADARRDGNADPAAIAAQITPATKAIVVTHMWGHPCDMASIADIARRNDLYLVEDCSHAHGATIDDRPVGSFGDVAVWSLQGQKNVTGGEGGILLTDNQAIFERALLLGQFNKRAKQQVDETSELYQFVTTGFGLKLRAHPLAIAMANEQLSHLDDWRRNKDRIAEKLLQKLGRYPFLRLPSRSGTQPAWYAFVFNYDGDLAGVPGDWVYEALQAEGLAEVDRPKSTGCLATYPLFTHTHEAVSRLYDGPALLNGDVSADTAEWFYRTAFKMPLWAFEDEESIADDYVMGLDKVFEAVYNHPDAFSGSNV